MCMFTTLQINYTSSKKKIAGLPQKTVQSVKLPDIKFINLTLHNSEIHNLPLHLYKSSYDIWSPLKRKKNTVLTVKTTEKVQTIIYSTTMFKLKKTVTL